MKHFVSIVLLLAFAPVTMAQKSPHTMMAVFAHADDEAFVGPLLAHYARQGAKIHLVIMTQGNAGRPGVSHGIPSGPNSSAFVPRKRSAPVANLASSHQ